MRSLKLKVRMGGISVVSPAAAASGFRASVRLIFFLLSSVLLVSCDRESAVEGERPVTHEQFSQQLVETGFSRTAMGEQWLDSAGDALANPLEIVPPYSESGGFVAHRAGALGLAFDAYDGQTLHLRFDRRDGSTGQVFVELFYLRGQNGGSRHVLLDALSPQESTMQMMLPHDGRYLLRLQPELLVDALYDLRVELDAAIPFPADDGDAGVGSFFGDPRDAGSRQHEGVDIFMPRHTPVLAVASGRAVARTTPRGGNVVWLRAKGRSYYYAHLEKAAFSRARNVEVGDVLGYVGNSGNAKSTPPHLHFGVYRRGYGAVDPLPRMTARRFEEPPPVVSFEPRYVRTRARKLNLRAAPGTSADIVAQLDGDTLVRASALRGDWLRVRTPENGSGWIHASYQEDTALLAHWRPQSPRWLFDAVAPDARPVAVAEAKEELEVIGRHGAHLLVRSPDGGNAGWVEAPVPQGAMAGTAVPDEAAGGDNDREQDGVSPGGGS